jgi:hypothetical protein
MAVRLSALCDRRTLLPTGIIIFMFLVPMLGGVPVPTARGIPGLRMEEQPPDIDVSCEFIE